MVLHSFNMLSLGPSLQVANRRNTDAYHIRTFCCVCLGARSRMDLAARLTARKVQDADTVGVDRDFVALQTEILAILAGPVAEMVYRDEPRHPAVFGPWKYDWDQAWQAAALIWADEKQRTRGLENLILELRQKIRMDPVWAAIAALADELVAHESLDEERVEEVLSFWFR